MWADCQEYVGRFSRKCGNLDVSEPYGPPLPVTGLAWLVRLETLPPSVSRLSRKCGSIDVSQPVWAFTACNRDRLERQADNLAGICGSIVKKMWEPRRLTTLWAFTACNRDSFTFYYLQDKTGIISWLVTSPSFQGLPIYLSSYSSTPCSLVIDSAIKEHRKESIF
jgi:hypothetical protein